MGSGYPTPAAAGGAWCGWDLLPRSGSYSSSVTSGGLSRLSSQPPLYPLASASSPSPHGGFSTQGVGGGEAVGERMLEGCGFSPTRRAGLERKCACV